MSIARLTLQNRRSISLGRKIKCHSRHTRNYKSYPYAPAAETHVADKSFNHQFSDVSPPRPLSLKSDKKVCPFPRDLIRQSLDLKVAS